MALLGSILTAVVVLAGLAVAHGWLVTAGENIAETRRELAAARAELAEVKEVSVQILEGVALAVQLSQSGYDLTVKLVKVTQAGFEMTHHVAKVQAKQQSDD